MYNFRNDYSLGAHKKILEKIIEFNSEVNTGYGLDMHCMRAASLIEKELDARADIHFISGGTQTNLLAAAAFLKPYQSIIAVSTAHILDNETGAIEATGHKIIEIPGEDGKISPQSIENIMRSYGSESKTQPKMVYITNATELGTIYSIKELEEISRVCKKYGLYLYMDGARLAHAIMSEESDLRLSDIARLTDAFFIGGTKNGLIMGEALVILNEELKPGFRYIYKQRGAMLAKGFFMGIQFEALFEDGLFYELGKYANDMAKKLSVGLREQNIEFYARPVTNQIFLNLSDELIERLSRDFLFETMILPNGEKVSRLVTSWATSEKDIDAILEFFRNENK
ncbi:MAG: aminotransferase class I/II-fold pyridoxal phosphate-dependent enzyme [Tissierellia bacterium]|nr:aminotransferase class I/II-fold pyridoxal phosphate-dependent enzyme [Tissierellia bacterium]